MKKILGIGVLVEGEEPMLTLSKSFIVDYNCNEKLSKKIIQSKTEERVDSDCVIKVVDKKGIHLFSFSAKKKRTTKEESRIWKNK
jgi:hypothetical protein